MIETLHSAHNRPIYHTGHGEYRKGDQDENSKTHQNNNVHLRNGYTSYAPDSTVFGNLSADGERDQPNADEPDQ